METTLIDWLHQLGTLEFWEALLEGFEGLGPFVPILLAMLESLMPVENPLLKKIMLFVVMALAITALEYVAGLIFIRGMKIKLWDYSDRWGNIQGIIEKLGYLQELGISVIYLNPIFESESITYRFPFPSSFPKYNVTVFSFLLFVYVTVSVVRLCSSSPYLLKSFSSTE